MFKNKKAMIYTFSFLGFIFNVQYASAEYIAKFPLEGLTAVSNLIDYAPLYSDWTNIGSTQNCTEWLPLANGIKSGEIFNQSASCDQPQERTVQQRKQNTKTNEIVNYGNPTKENQNIKVSITQSAIGTGVSGAGCLPVGSDWGYGFWLVGTTGDIYMVYYGIAGGSEYVAASPTKDSTSYTSGDYTYTRGNFEFTSGGDYYEVCRN